MLGGYSPSLPAGVDWPLAAGDRFAPVSMESPFSGACGEGSGTFGTYDASLWQETGDLTLAHEYALDGNGPYHEGRAPLNVWGCTTYGFEVHPGYAAASSPSLGRARPPGGSATRCSTRSTCTGASTSSGCDEAVVT